jgi:hypothetical protein
MPNGAVKVEAGYAPMVDSQGKEESAEDYRKRLARLGQSVRLEPRNPFK